MAGSKTFSPFQMRKGAQALLPALLFQMTFPHFALFKRRPGYFQIQISETIRRVEQQYGIKLDREPMMSILLSSRKRA